MLAAGLALLQAAWDFVKSPLGRQMVLWGAALLILVACGCYGYHAGVAHQKAVQAALDVKAAAKVAKRETAAAKISTAAGAALVQTRTEIRWRTKTLKEKVTVYVTPQADDRCIVPVGFVQLHDAAAAGTTSLPAAAGGSLDAASGVPLSAVSDTVTDNYGVAYDWQAEALTWRGWYVREEAEWLKP